MLQRLAPTTAMGRVVRRIPVSATLLTLLLLTLPFLWGHKFALPLAAAKLDTPPTKKEGNQELGRQLLSARTGTSITPISSSIFLSGEWDYLPYDGTGSGRSRCTDMVDRAAAYNIDQLQFVPTFYWVDEGPLKPPPGFDPTCKNSDLGGYYCFNRFNATRVKHWCYSRDGTCLPVNATQMESFATHVGACMKYAASKGLGIAVNARVDDGLSLGGWRNTLVLDPLEHYGNYSYLKAILYPLADAVRLAIDNSTHVDFEMQGEMGATAFFYPRQWITAGNLVRQHILAGAPPSWKDLVKIGLGMNNNKLCGCINIGIVDAREYLGNFSAAFSAIKSDFDIKGIQDLFRSVDFVGLSAYVPMTTPWFDVCDLECLVERFDEEMGYYNITLRELSDQGVEIHWTEFGLGGGCSNNGDCMATTAEQAAYYPFWGVWGEYRCDRDPWQLCSPNKPSPVRDYSRYYYNHTASYLEQGGCDYHVSAVYVWNLGSWDVQAIYPGSSSGEGSFRDPVVAGIINSHNARAGIEPPVAEVVKASDGV